MKITSNISLYNSYLLRDRNATVRYDWISMIAKIFRLKIFQNWPKLNKQFKWFEEILIARVRAEDISRRF